MPRIARFVVIVAVAFGAIASTAAADQYFVDGEPLWEPVAGEGTIAASVVTTGFFYGGPRLLIAKCEKGTLSGTLETEGKSTLALSLGKCTATTPGLPPCTVQPITANLKGQLVKQPVELELKGAGANFLSITLTNCPQAQTLNLTGSQLCSLPNGSTEQHEHEFVCSSKGSSLKSGTNVASFEGVERYTPNTGSIDWSMPAAPPVLTAGAAGLAAANVAKTDILKSSGGSTAKFEGANANEWFECNQSEIEGEVMTNGRSGNNAAQVKITDWTYSNPPVECGASVNNLGVKVVKVENVDMLTKPFPMSLSDAAGLPVTITSSGGKVLVAFTVKIEVAPQQFEQGKICEYEGTEVKGTFSNAGGEIKIVNQVLNKNPIRAAWCPAQVKFSKTYGPLEDVTKGLRVFVN